jgi:hypothetical protein
LKTDFGRYEVWSWEKQPNYRWKIKLGT